MERQNELRLTRAEKRIIAELRQLKYGEMRIVMRNGVPVQMEAAAREKLEAAKTLLEKTYQPSFKTDKNLLTMAQARLTAGKIEGVTVAMKAAVSTKDLFTAARAGIDLDGTLHYKWNDNGSTNSTTGRASARPIPHAIMSPAICSRSWRSSPTETAINSSAQTRTPSGPA